MRSNALYDDDTLGEFAVHFGIDIRCDWLRFAVLFARMDLMSHYNWKTTAGMMR